jgi:undecaprenyl-diphosphatase
VPSLHVTELLARYGYGVLAVFVFGEGIMVPFPADTMLITAAALAARGHLTAGLVFVVAAAGSFAGTTCAYVAGLRGGSFVQRHTRAVGARRLAWIRDAFARHGASAVVAGRFIPFMRMFIYPVAGIARMRLRTFVLSNLAGSVIWAALFTGVGYFFGLHIGSFGRFAYRAGLLVVVGLAALACIVVAGGWLAEDSDAAWRAEGTIWHEVLAAPPIAWLARHSPRARAFLFRRFTPGDYLGLNLTLGLGLSFVALVLFAALIQRPFMREARADLDVAVLQALTGAPGSHWISFWTSVRKLASWPALIMLGFAAAIHAGWRRRLDLLPLIGWGSAIVGAGVLDLVLRHALRGRVPVLAPSGESFALGTMSAQSLEALVGYGMISYLLVLTFTRRSARVGTIAVGSLVILAVSFSGLYLGQQFLSEVVTGLAVGGVWLSACVLGVEVARRTRGSGDVPPVRRERRAS